MITWPISVPIYGAVWLLSVIATSNVINKFTDNYWFVISLRFLNGKALAMPGPTRPLSLHADMPAVQHVDAETGTDQINPVVQHVDAETGTDQINPAVQHVDAETGTDQINPAVQHVDAETGTDQINPFSNVGVSPDSVLPAPIDPWESSDFSPWDDPTTDDYLACTLEDVRLLGWSCSEGSASLTYSSWCDCTLQLLHACNQKNFAADARIFDYIKVSQPEKFCIWEFCATSNFANVRALVFPQSRKMDRMEQIALLNYLGRCYPQLKAEFLAWLRSCDKPEDMFWKKYSRAAIADPATCVKLFFDSNGKPTDMSMVFPPPFVAKAWKAKRQNIGQLFQSMDMNNKTDVQRALHILQGLPITEVVDALQTLPNETLVRLLAGSLECGYLWAVHIFIQMNLARAKEIFSACAFTWKEMLKLADAMRRKNPQRHAEFFLLARDKDLLNVDLLYTCILNMPVDAAVEFLAQNNDILVEIVWSIPDFVRAFPTEKVCRICWEILSNDKLGIYKRDGINEMFCGLIVSESFICYKHIFQLLIERAGISDTDMARFIVESKKGYQGSDGFVSVDTILRFCPSKRAANIRRLIASLEDPTT
ncbi:MAG: hypothetical protein LBD72_03035 [Puniceicoccales bacterium]|nr:hypothetical protein [Puniceicoccales bacterium]